MEHVDVLIVGAGLSGIGAACHLRQECPGKSFVILEGRGAMGGTWDSVSLPGRPLRLGHVHARLQLPAVARREGHRRRPRHPQLHPRDGRRVRRGPDDSLRPPRDERVMVVRRRALDGGSRDGAGEERRPVHLQLPLPLHGLLRLRGRLHARVARRRAFPRARWCTRRSGRKTSTTRASASSSSAAGRPPSRSSPRWPSAPRTSRCSNARRPTSSRAPPRTGLRTGSADACRRARPTRSRVGRTCCSGCSSTTCRGGGPNSSSGWSRRGCGDQLGEEYDLKHFTPQYNPWDQRLCLVPDADLFRAIRDGRASVVTDHIESFTETGLQLKSGEHLDADIIVTATGLVLKLLSGMRLAVDGAPLDAPRTFVYKGMMFSGVPNLAFAIGYTNASWTLKCDLTAEYVCRLLNHMERHGYASCTPRVNDPDVKEEPMHRLHLRLRAAGHPHAPEAGLEDALASPPELRQRPLDDAVRPRRRRGDGVRRRPFKPERSGKSGVSPSSRPSTAGAGRSCR